MRLFSSGRYLTIEDNHALLASIRYSPGAWLKNHSLHPQSLKPVISQKAFFSTLLRSGPAKKQVEIKTEQYYNSFIMTPYIKKKTGGISHDSIYRKISGIPD